MSSLRRFAHLAREPQAADARRACERAWHEAGIVCINPAWLGSWADQKQLELLAQKVFGPRRDSQEVTQKRGR